MRTGAEREALDSAGGRAIRGFSTLTGHLKEAQFPFAIALAALAIKAGSGYPAFDANVEKEFAGKPDAVLATAIGFDRYEGAALVQAARHDPKRRRQEKRGPVFGQHHGQAIGRKR